MSDETQQTNWFVLIVIAAVLAAPGWYLYYEVSVKSERDGRNNTYKIQHLEKQLNSAHKTESANRTDWNRRFQDANQAVISINEELRIAKTELIKVRSEADQAKEAISDFKTGQADLNVQLKTTNITNVKLTAELEEKHTISVGLSSKLASMQDEFRHRQDQSDVIQKQLKASLTAALQKNDAIAERLANKLASIQNESG